MHALSCMIFLGLSDLHWSQKGALLSVTSVLKRQYANTWMLTCSPWCFSIFLYQYFLCTRGPSEKQLLGCSKLCWRPTSRAAVLLGSHTPAPQRHVDIPPCQTRQQVLILSVPTKKTFFRFPQYLCYVLVCILMAYHQRHGWCCNYSVVIILPQKPIVRQHDHQRLLVSSGIHFSKEMSCVSSSSYRLNLGSWFGEGR